MRDRVFVKFSSSHLNGFSRKPSFSSFLCDLTADSRPESESQRVAYLEKKKTLGTLNQYGINIRSPR